MTEWREPVTMSAYDLLPDEDRKAIAWVREHGGLDSVEDAIKTNEWALSLAVIAHDALFGEDSERDTTPTEFKREIDKRLMPAGMEWPMFEDNEPVRFGDEHENGKGNASPLNRVCFYIDGTTILGRGQTKVRLAPGERVKRPAPKVVDADGVEIHAGDVLYSVETGGSVTVDSIEPGNPWFATTDGALQHCAKFTHRAPVLAADGKPLKVGEHVWNAEIRRFGTVEDIFETELCGKLVRFAYDGGGYGAYDASRLAHERPETWERINDDASLAPAVYCDRYSLFDEDDYTTAMAQDLVRRARNLAERGA